MMLNPEVTITADGAAAMPCEVESIRCCRRIIIDVFLLNNLVLVCFES